MGGRSLQGVANMPSSANLPLSQEAEIVSHCLPDSDEAWDLLPHHHTTSSLPLSEESCRISKHLAAIQNWFLNNGVSTIHVAAIWPLFFPSCLFVYGTRTTCSWHLWLSFLLYVSYKTSKSKNGLLCLYWLNQSDVTLPYISVSLTCTHTQKKNLLHLCPLTNIIQARSI